MIKVHIVIGDLLEAVSRKDVDFFGHGCNCRKNMGGGIAKKIADNWAEMRIADAEDNRPSMLRLGDFTRAYLNTNGVIGYNLYSQMDPGPNADINAVQTSLTASLENLGCMRVPKPVEFYGLPAIGAGIGGLGLIQVVLSINAVFTNYNLNHRDNAIPVLFLQPEEFKDKLAILKLWGYPVHQSIEEVHFQYGLSL